MAHARKFPTTRMGNMAPVRIEDADNAPVEASHAKQEEAPEDVREVWLRVAHALHHFEWLLGAGMRQAPDVQFALAGRQICNFDPKIWPCSIDYVII